MMQHLKVLMAQPVFYVPFSPGEIVIYHKDFVSVHHQLVHKMGTNKTGAASHKDPFSVFVGPELDLWEGTYRWQSGFK